MITTIQRLLIITVRMDDHIGTNTECTGVVVNPVEDEKARNPERVDQRKDVQIRATKLIKGDKYSF